jgi:hypothetical protein
MEAGSIIDVVIAYLREYRYRARNSEAWSIGAAEMSYTKISPENGWKSDKLARLPGT